MEPDKGQFYEGKKPSLVNVHEAYTSRKIAMEEAQDLNPNYEPTKIIGTIKSPTGKTYPRTQAYRLDDAVKQRKTKTGNYKYQDNT